MKPYYQDESVTIYHGDCRDVLPQIDDDGLVLTDPPYGIQHRKGVNPSRSSSARAGIIGDEDTTIRDLALRLLVPRPSFVFGSIYAPFQADIRHICIWLKRPDSGVYGSNYGFRRDVEAVFVCGDFPRRKVAWSSVLTGFPQPRNGHPHAKPVGLCRWLIDTQPEFDLVIDPFLGSGTTLRAAKDLGRRGIGIEIDEQFCEIAAKRMEQTVLPMITRPARKQGDLFDEPTGEPDDDEPIEAAPIPF